MSSIRLHRIRLFTLWITLWKAQPKDEEKKTYSIHIFKEYALYWLHWINYAFNGGYVVVHS